MSSREECAEYFKSQPEYRRIFEEMRRKWESLGRTAGKVTLEKGTDREKKALERLLGKVQEKEKLTFSLPEFERALGETRYGGVSLKELLEEYFGEPMVGNRERKQRKKDREQEFWDELERQVRGAKAKEQEAGRDIWADQALSWIKEMREQKNQGYAVVMREYQKSEESARERIREVVRYLRICRCLRGWEPPDFGETMVGNREKKEQDRQALAQGYERCGREGIRLAVLAAKATGNPHALDRQNTTGILLSYVLCRSDGGQFPENARKWKELYEKNGIVVDELSSTVAAFGIHLMTDEGLHPAYEGFGLKREPCIISLANLVHVKGAFGESENIYVVENEMVFSELTQRLSGYPVTLLCTSGQPRTAVYRLMELLCEGSEKTALWYAGDMDPEGLDIAQRICDSFPGRVHIWRMGEEDYEKALSQEQVSERRMEMMKNLTHPVLKGTAGKIWKQKCAGYQEMLIEEMAEDVKVTVMKYLQEGLEDAVTAGTAFKAHTIEETGTGA